jgi:hypothetical protein
MVLLSTVENATGVFLPTAKDEITLISSSSVYSESIFLKAY